ncbi:hypothetical protein CEXT_49361 [Caerostris extrusa]|uniref:Uncharacterized protein n=1 Tax=Caerostris extrusa TaxID=172846 RepID=A0AAV4XMW8_CAEEX|nr:hypothetical protein CEXT_49361 [Caerostris extrusa]
MGMGIQKIKESPKYSAYPTDNTINTFCTVMACDVAGKEEEKDGRGTLNPNREKLQTIINKTAQTVTQHPPEERFGGSFEGGGKKKTCSILI